jgi:DNA-binding CsgD family transcriptional regulator/tetratricopeptide (TPR) repeat protein
MRDQKRDHPDGRGEGPKGDLVRGRDLYRRRAWGDAFGALSRADRAGLLRGEDLDRLALSAGFLGRDEDMLNAMERAYRAHRSSGDYVRAARSAFWLGFRLVGLNEKGRAGGWFARAQRLLEREGRECVEQGYLLLPVAHRHLSAGESRAAYDAAAGAAAIGDRFGDPDLVAIARNLQGQALLREGRVEDGLAFLDEAMVAAIAGELSPLVTGLIYCSVIYSCQQVYALGRAREWTSALTVWCEEQPETVFTGQCLVIRAEILQWNGAWRDAIAEAQRASGRLSVKADPQVAAAALYQEAEVHRLRGEFEEAERAYRSASRSGREPQPGLALLRLAQGRTDAAAAQIQRAVAAATDPLKRARLLPAFIEILLAAGSIEEARKGLRELEEIAGTFDTDVLWAIVDHARGGVALAEGDARGALPPLRRSQETWQRVGAPYIAARLRVLTGLACRALGDEEGASLELDAARVVFEELGAAPDLDRVASLAKGAPAGRPHGLTPRELEVLRLVASGKTNKVIAARLFLSEKTVDRHLSNIFTKLDVSSRAAATAFAYEHGLV